MKTIVILGSTGSIGRQTLEVIEREKKYTVIGLTCGNNLELFNIQVATYKNSLRAIASLATNNKKYTGIIDLSVDNFNDEIITLLKPDLVVNALVGSRGLSPTITALNNNIDVALANKESLVIGGELINKILKTSRGKIYPIDSEHSALTKCLSNDKCVDNLILTASGGAARNYPLEKLSTLTKEEILIHPTWVMGKRITVDCATMVNKAFEVIEAHYLFNISLEHIKILLHDESKIHSLVQYKDGSYLADIGEADMRIPISYALNKMKRSKEKYHALDLDDFRTFSFRKFDKMRYPAIETILDAFAMGGSAMAAINAIDEVAVEYFLDGKIKFTDIALTLKEVFKRVRVIDNPTLDELLYVGRYVSKETEQFLQEEIHNG